MEKIDLKEELKKSFPYHNLDDKYDLFTKQFDYYDITGFAYQMIEKALDLAKKNAKIKQMYNIHGDVVQTFVEPISIINTIKQFI